MRPRPIPSSVSASGRAFQTSTARTRSCAASEPSKSARLTRRYSCARASSAALKYARGSRLGMSRRGTLVRQRKNPDTTQTAARANRPARFANVRLLCEWPSSPTFTGISMRSSPCSAPIDAESPDEVWCLGDLVGYGPRPNRCCELVAERADVCLIGNHDLGVLGRIDLDDFSPDAAAAARWTADVLEDEPRRYLESQSPSAVLDACGALPREPARPGLGVRARARGRVPLARGDREAARPRRSQPRRALASAPSSSPSRLCEEGPRSTWLASAGC